MPPLKRTAVTILLVLGMAARVAAEPPPACPTPGVPCHLRMREPVTVQKDDGTSYRLPQGHFLDTFTWELLDNEVKRLQDQENRLTAENISLKNNLKNATPGWPMLLVVVAGAVVTGLTAKFVIDRLDAR